MRFPPAGSASLCECAACHRGFVSTEAFDAHRQGFRCLEPSAVGMWLATDGLWSITPRSAETEHARRRAAGIALKQAQEAP